MYMGTGRQLGGVNRTFGWGSKISGSKSENFGAKFEICQFSKKSLKSADFHQFLRKIAYFSVKIDQMGGGGQK